MKVSTVDNQNFSGRAFVIGSNKRKELTAMSRELNKMNLLKNADCNVYLAYGHDVFEKYGVVKIYAKEGGFHWKTDSIKLVQYGENAALNIGAVKAATERVINSYKKV